MHYACSMAATPEVQLLANGDILVPVKAEGEGGWRISRVTLDDAEYAEWLGFVQQRDRRPGLLAKGIAFWASAALLVIGFWVFVIVIALLAHLFR